ncbi:cupredoxin domain-containing protein [Arthrobacter humicola]|uniref:cupredoxin domain-containing protein n=1 Tax=Arthrobacter humicola TaxID=409291 RepID=UPI001FAC9FB3|nr:cupredoxin domain-containing protein [Arthrobacter humicola]MCI9869382.1 cupredoxin domain-containing protein [Arthrobacter humicola]
MTSNKTRTALVLATVLIGLSGCAGGGGTQASAPATTAGTSPSMSMEPSAPAGSTSGPGSGAANAAAATITISNFAYEIPGAVAPGAEVKVINMDTAEHTVTADQNATLFDVEVKENGGTATFKAPSEPGTYAFHCNYHPNMHGSLTVK